MTHRRSRTIKMFTYAYINGVEVDVEEIIRRRDEKGIEVHLELLKDDGRPFDKHMQAGADEVHCEGRQLIIYCDPYDF